MGETEGGCFASQCFPSPAQNLSRTLRQEVKEGKMDQAEAENRMLEQTGMSLAEAAPKRTTSGSSWSEEVEHMKRLDAPSLPVAVEEEADKIPDEDQDQAQFELRQERKAHSGGRAAGSHLPAEGAAGSPSGI